MSARVAQGSLAQKFASYPKTFAALATLLVLLGWPRDDGKTTRIEPPGAIAGCPVLGTRYGIMMDAGSTGSRTHVFEFTFHEDGRKELVREVFEQLKPGLSAYPNDPQAAANSLKPLMDIAVKEIPAQHQRCTPLALKATAGLRLIGHEKSEAILRAVERLFAEYPFHVPSADAAVVMDGKDEGPYAWITVNFLLGNLDGKSKTVATFDMGGGSTQVVFVPDDAKVLDRDNAPSAHVYSLKLLGHHFKLYTHSFLGLGLKEAGKSIVAQSTGKDFPCIAAADDVVANQLSFAKCRPYAEKILGKDAKCEYRSCSIRGVYQPKLTQSFTGDLYVFSYFYDRMEPFLAKDGKSTVGAFREIGSKICANEGKEYSDHNKGTMCMDFVFLYSILNSGYDLPDETPLIIKKTINGVEAQWPLGAMLVAMS